MAKPVEMIDAHHHLWPSHVISAQSWRPAQDAVLRRAFEPEDFADELAAARVTGTVLMQSVDEASENIRLLDYARRTAFIRGVVAWAPLTRPDEARTIIRRLATDAENAPGGKVVGVRCLIGHDDADWALTPAAIDNFHRLADAALSWDIVPVNARQVAAVVSVSERVPQLRVIVDHLARPPLNADGWDRWCESIRVLATQPRIAIKLSVGVDALSGSTLWDRELLRPYVDHAVAAFGARRAMVASNWPVILLQTGYAQAWSDTIALAGDAVDDADALARVTADTAIEWYGLNKESHT